jgi:GntR family transcriptional regulator
MANTPLYVKVRDQLVDSLVRKEWSPGELLPSEKQLSQRYAVAISTVRAAIGELVDANVLVRVQGKGTFVSHHAARDNRYRFFNVRSNDGHKSPLQRELVSVRREPATTEELQTFLIAPTRRTQDVFRIRARFQTEGDVFAMADIVVPASLFSGLENAHLPDGEESLYAIYQARFGINIIRVEEEISAVGASAAVARTLGLETRDPVLEVRRVAFTFNEVAVERRTTWVHTRHHHYYLSQGKAS